MNESQYPMLDIFAPSRTPGSPRTCEDATFVMHALDRAGQMGGKEVPDWLYSYLADFMSESHHEFKYCKRSPLDAAEQRLIKP